MLGKIQRKNVIENIVPVVIELKSKLEQMRSPLLRFLMGYLKELVSDYKDEIADILATDLQLAKEIEYDMRKFGEQQQHHSKSSYPRTPNFHALLTPKKGTPGSNIPVPSLRKSSIRRLSIPYNPDTPVEKSKRDPESDEEDSPRTNHPKNSKIHETPALRKMRNAEVNLAKSPFEKKKKPRKNQNTKARNKKNTKPVKSKRDSFSSDSEAENKARKKKQGGRKKEVE